MDESRSFPPSGRAAVKAVRCTKYDKTLTVLCRDACLGMTNLKKITENAKN